MNLTSTRVIATTRIIAAAIGTVTITTTNEDDAITHTIDANYDVTNISISIRERPTSWSIFYVLIFYKSSLFWSF